MLLAALALIVASCGNGGDETSNPPADDPPAVGFDGTSWLVTSGSLDGAALAPATGRAATLSVTGDQVTGTTGCNTYTADLQVGAAGSLTFSDFAVTEIGCEQAAMDFEARMLDILQAVDGFDWDADRLSLRSSDGSARLELRAAASEPSADLAGSWNLTGVVTGDTVSSTLSGTQPLLEIDLEAGAIRGNGGCNDFGAQAAFADARVTVTEMIYTELACEEAIMRQEADVFRTLASATSWEISGDTLTVTGDGSALTFTTAGC